MLLKPLLEQYVTHGSVFCNDGVRRRRTPQTHGLYGVTVQPQYLVLRTAIHNRRG